MAAASVTPPVPTVAEAAVTNVDGNTVAAGNVELILLGRKNGTGRVDTIDLQALLTGTLTTAPTSAGDVAGTLTSGRKTITTAGTAAAIVGSSTPCKWVQVVALKTNTQDVYVGGAATVADAGSQAGVPLAAGQAETIPVNDAAKVFVDVLVNGEGVTFLVGS